MYMLHARRKAEIEVLSSSGLGLLKNNAMIAKSGSAKGNLPQLCSDNVLLQYLVIKISEAVASGRIDAEHDGSDEDEDMD